MKTTPAHRVDANVPPKRRWIQTGAGRQVACLACGAALWSSALSYSHGAGPIEWVERCHIAHPTGNLQFQTVWGPARGLHFRVTDAAGQKTAMIEVAAGKGLITLAPSTNAPGVAMETAQYHLAALPPQALMGASVLLKIRREHWTLYVEGRPIVVTPAPFSAPARLSVPATELPPPDRRDVRFQKTADFRFTDDFLVPEGEDGQLAAWDIVSGTWLLHTAVDNAVSIKSIAPDAKNKPEPARSPNFYSLEGKGDRAIILTGYDFYDLYHCEAAVQIESGEIGLVFYHRSPERYYAFTARKGTNSHDAVLSLWGLRSGDPQRREVLGAVLTELTDKQWVKLKVRTYATRVECLVDGQVVLDVPHELPEGGRFGLFVTSDTGMRFDDVAAASNLDLDLKTMNGLRRHALRSSGGFLSAGGSASLFPAAEIPCELSVRGSSASPQWLALGSVAHSGQAFSARFEPEGGDWAVGLMAGFVSADRPYYRFVCQQAAGRRAFRLERVDTNDVKTVESFQWPVTAAAPPSAAVTLMGDATTEGELRLYSDGRLVLFHNPPKDFQGASGLWVGARTSARISSLDYRFQRDDLYRNQFEKNRLFVEDPYMRHWSSPEGEWLERPDKTIWHKSDFFGRFLMRLPFVSGAEVHLGVEEGHTNGAVVLHATDDNVNLHAGGEGNWTTRLLEKAPPFEWMSDRATNRWLTVHYEDHWLWVTADNYFVFRYPFPTPLKGTRVRLAGFTNEELKHSYVERFSVKDHIFTESLHEWIVNGGTWEVINRFQCQPRWSNMTGESNEGMAALWTKFLFAGDFCAEMYVGIRHGPWYSRCGDLNLTVMNRDTTPSQGYTVTCTGWDVDHSQLYTRLYRHGRLTAESDKYLVPRNREGNTRQGYNPLVAEGRPVHGAWYYVKLRRIGRQLEYYYDNELVFSTEDADPVAEGSLGIWTFMNSMVVARVKMAAQAIRRRPVVFRPLNVRAGEIEWSAPAAPAAGMKDLVKDGRWLDAALTENWEVEDPVGCSALSWHSRPGASPSLVVRNQLGSGSMLTRCHLPPVRLSELAGWRFRVKRTPRAQFNFLFSIGRVDTNGAYASEQRFFHRISGTDFSRGAWRMAGQTDVPGEPATNGFPQAASEGAVVYAWLPTAGLETLVQDAGLYARAEGFGNLQPSYEIQGLYGNGPGESYAISDFSEVRYRPPVFEASTNAPAPDELTLRSVAGGDWGRFRDVSELQAGVDARADTGLVEAVLVTRQTGRENGRDRRRELAWIRLPDVPAVECAWSRDQAAVLDLTCPVPYPDRRFCFARVTVGGEAVEAIPAGFGKRLVPVPRGPALTVPGATNLAVVVAFDDKTSCSFTMDRQAAPCNEGPVLLSLEGVSPFYENFERRSLAAPLEVNPARMELVHFDPRQGTYLDVFNAGEATRLAGAFAAALNMAQYPLFQFRYRAPEMARTSISLGGERVVNLGERAGGAKVDGSGVLVRDGTWRTWYGDLSDAVKKLPLQPSVYALQRLAFGSVGEPDQTGLYTRWSLDDLVFGPAVSSAEQVGFTPRYADADGVQTVWAACRAGRESYTELKPDDVRRLAWREVPNGERSVPDIQGLSDGMCRLFLKARDGKGLESAVTDIPFLLDTQPPPVSGAFRPTQDLAGNESTLRVVVSTAGGAPLDLEKTQLRWGSEPEPLGPFGSFFIHSNDADVMDVNWPYLFRSRLDAATNGQACTLVLANIRDGAGNAAPDWRISFPIDYRKDKTPPTLLSVVYPTNVLWACGWEGVADRSPRFSSAHYNKVAMVEKFGEEPFLSTTTYGQVGRLQLDLGTKKWNPGAHPYLSFRMRRPTCPTNAATQITVELEVDEKQTYTVSLTHPVKPGKGTAFGLPSPIDWRSNEWQHVTLDLREVLKPGVDPDPMKQMVIKKLHFNRAKSPAEEDLHLQSVTIYSDWRASDRLTLSAFDASGMAGLTIEGESGTNRVDGMGFSPFDHRAAAGSAGWLRVRVRDKAGQEMWPVRIPVPRATDGSQTGGPKP